MRAVLAPNAEGSAAVDRNAKRPKKRSACPATTSHDRVRHPNHASGTSAADPRHHVDGLLVRKSPDVIDEVCMQ
jgi:hypothetical protein